MRFGRFYNVFNLFSYHKTGEIEYIVQCNVLIFFRGIAKNGYLRYVFGQNRRSRENHAAQSLDFFQVPFLARMHRVSLPKSILLEDYPFLLRGPPFLAEIFKFSQTPPPADIAALFSVPGERS